MAMINFNADIHLTGNINHVESYLDLNFICLCNDVLTAELRVLLLVIMPGSF